MGGVLVPAVGKGFLFNKMETIMAGKKKSKDTPVTETAPAAPIEALSNKVYDKQLKRLHVELVKLQQWVVAKGLKVPAYVKTSLSPGSGVVTKYLEAAGLLEDLRVLGYHIAGYGCMTCIGNSGPLHDNLAAAIDEANSGNEVPIATTVKPIINSLTPKD